MKKNRRMKIRCRKSRVLGTPEELMDKRRFHSYSKFKLPADSEDDTADDLTFGVGKT